MSELQDDEIEIGIILPRRTTYDGVTYIIEKTDERHRIALRGRPEAVERVITMFDLDWRSLLDGAKAARGIR